MKNHRFISGAAACMIAFGINASNAAQALTPDLFLTPTEEEAALFTIIDSNHDRVTWGFHNETKVNHQYVFSSTVLQDDYASSELPHNDWLILPAINFENSNILYEFKMDAARGTFSSYYGLDETFEVYMGTAPSAQAMTIPIMEEKHLTLAENKDGKFKTFSEVFSVPTPGTYYIGIHATSSDKKSIGIFAANFEVKSQGSSIQAPNTVNNLSISPGMNGSLSAILLFYMPTTDTSGATLDPATEIRAVAKSSVDTKEVTGAPGSIQLIENLATVQGYNDITVTTYIGEECGKSVTMSVYTGVSVPGAVTDMKCTASDDDMTLHFSWAPPTKAAHGGVVAPTGNTYTIYQELTNVIMGMETTYWDKLCDLPEDQTYFDYTIPSDGTQRKVRIGVTCRNAAGIDNTIMTIGEGLGGRPYELPMYEDFTTCSLSEFTYNPIVNYEINSDYKGQTWTVNDPYIIDPKYNDRHRPAIIFSNHVGDRTRVALPKFSTKGIMAPTATFSVYMGQVTPKMSIYAQTVGTDWIKISDIDIDATAEAYRTVVVPLPEQFADKSWVYVSIDTENHPDSYEIAFVASYGFSNMLEKDLGIRLLNGKSPVVGESERYTATIYNPGRTALALSSLKWTVKAGSEVLAEKTETSAGTLQPGTSKEYYFDFVPQFDQLGSATVGISIEAAGDMDIANNYKELPIVIKTGGRILVNDLKAESAEGGVRLSWTAPFGNYKTEGFESEKTFETLPATIADFTNIDGDGYQVWNFGEHDPLGGYPQAYTVWSQREAETYALSYKSYKGDKYLMVRCPGDELAIPPLADDWLISPEINPSTFVSFYARPISNLYGNESMEILYSTTTADRESFKLLESLTIEVVEIQGEISSDITLAWLKYSTELPADARYFAIHYVSHDIFGVMLDELVYSPLTAANAITGYNIYRDDTLIAENADVQDSYLDTTASGNHSYCVEPCTADKLGGFSNVAEISLGSVALTGAGLVKARGINGGIVVETPAAAEVKVFAVSGALMADSTVAAGTTTLALPAGFYVVTVGEHTFKVVVK